MNKGKILAIALLILSSLVLALYLIYPAVLLVAGIVGMGQNSSPVGIIGGADGPTVTLVASSLFGGVFSLILIVLGLIFFTGSIVYLAKHRTKK